MRTLTAADVPAAVTGGSVRAAGGGGWFDHGYLVGETATRLGEPRLASIDEIPDDGIIVTVTAIGSPAARNWQMLPIDYVRALHLLIEALGQPVAGLITAQNGASTTLNGWTASAVLAAQTEGAEAVIAAAVRETKGRILGRGPVRDARVDTRDSFDFARFRVEDPDGTLLLHTMNEYMAVDRDGTRLATFPDLICT